MMIRVRKADRSFFMHNVDQHSSIGTLDRTIQCCVLDRFTHPRIPKKKFHMRSLTRKIGLVLSQ